jgi:hypothetical protein
VGRIGRRGKSDHFGMLLRLMANVRFDRSALKVCIVYVQLVRVGLFPLSRRRVVTG